MPRAIADFEKKFKDKTKNVWGTPFSPFPGKYHKVAIDYEEIDEKALQKLSGKKITVKDSNLDKNLQDFISLIFNENMFKEQMEKFEIDVKKMPLGRLSREQIKSGLEVLAEIKSKLESGSRSKSGKTINQLTDLFYTRIPHSVGRRVPPAIDNLKILEEKFELLNVLGDIALAVSLHKDGAETVGDDVIKPHPLDEHYKSLHCKLALVDKTSEEFKIIEKYTEQTKRVGGPRIIDVFRVERETEKERYSQHSDLGNRKLLWHGTNIAVVAAILNSGLRIMPHSGGRVGRGIYLASENQKSAAYVGRSGNIGCMFLCEAVLGREHHIQMDDPSLRAAPPGFESIIALGRQEPDKAFDVVIKIDGNDVVVPQSKAVKTPYQSSAFNNSEYLVYKESQAALRYVLKMEF